MDEKLLAILDGLIYTSKFKTWICIQLADLAAQSCGYRSTRQIRDIDDDLVSDKYNELLDKLLNTVYEFKAIIETRTSEYKSEIISMSTEELENKMDDVLITAVLYDDLSTFRETLFE